MSQDFCPSPARRRLALLSKWGDIPRNTVPGDEYPRNIASPPEGRMLQEYRHLPFRIFAPHICDVVYSNNFVILSSY
jgi:hypothetical protein